jgi:hypothetical protein
MMATANCGRRQIPHSVPVAGALGWRCPDLSGAPDHPLGGRAEGFTQEEAEQLRISSFGGPDGDAADAARHGEGLDAVDKVAYGQCLASSARGRLPR